MGNFDRRGKRSGGGFDGRKSFDRRGGGRPMMHDAVCSDCGNDCRVPFRPTGGKPVLCSDCFSGQDSRGGRDRGRDRGARRERPRYEDKRMYDAVCSDCGVDCQVPFRPTRDKPVRCNDCFGGQDNRSDRQNKSGSDKKGRGSEDIAKQIKELNAKIDKLFEALVPNTSVEGTEEQETEKKEKSEKKEKPKTKKKTATKKVSTKKKK